MSGQFLKWSGVDENYAGNAYSITSRQPQIKPKHLFFVEFNISPQGLKSLSSSLRELSFRVKNVDKPRLSLENQTLNQYNRPRNVTTKINYNSFNISFYDTPNGTAWKLISDYLSFCLGDFNGKAEGNWSWDLLRGEATSSWGTRLKQVSTTNFFSSITVYDFFNVNYTCWSWMNPKLESLDLQQGDHSTADNNEINITCKPEGLVFKAIGANVNSSLARKFGMPYASGTTGNFLISGGVHDNPNGLFDGGGGILSDFGGLFSNVTGSLDSIGSVVSNVTSVGNLFSAGFSGLSFVGSSLSDGLSSGSSEEIKWSMPNSDKNSPDVIY